MWHQLVTLRICLLFVFLTISDVVNLTRVVRRQSGIDEVNENEQFVVRRLSPEQNLEVKRTFLKLLKLPEIPENIIDNREQLMKKSTAQFMLNLYQIRLPNDDGQIKKKIEFRSEFNLSDEEIKAIDESRTVTAFVARENNEKPGGNPNGVENIWFNVSSVPKDKESILGSLKLYRESDAKDSGTFTINVYQILGQNNVNIEEQLLDSVNTHGDQKGWIPLDVSKSLKHWIDNPEDNKGLYLSAHPINDSSVKIQLEDIGIVGSMSAADHLPFLVGYFQDKDQARQSIVKDDVETTRNRRDVPNTPLRNIKGSNGIVVDPKIIYSIACNKYSLPVKFADIGLQDTILVPTRYEAYYCDGICNLPFTVNINVTNHAIIQNLANSINPSTVPKSCCVPTTLKPMSIIYIVDNYTVRTENHQDMIVGECGCR